MNHDARTGDLQRVLSFDEADLECNRAGTMSERQKQRIKRGAVGSLVVTAVACGLLIWVLTLPAATFVRPLLLKTLYGGILGLIAILSLVVYRRDTAVARLGTVARASGTPSIEKRRAIHRMTVDGQELWLSRPVERVLESGDAFHFYYATNSPVLLSAEPISSPTPDQISSEIT